MQIAAAATFEDRKAMGFDVAWFETGDATPAYKTYLACLNDMLVQPSRLRTLGLSMSINWQMPPCFQRETLGNWVPMFLVSLVFLCLMWAGLVDTERSALKLLPAITKGFNSRTERNCLQRSKFTGLCLKAPIQT
jgi:hypothetical protein